jgi:hypothetical protein
MKGLSGGRKERRKERKEMRDRVKTDGKNGSRRYVTTYGRKREWNKE